MWERAERRPLDVGVDVDLPWDVPSTSPGRSHRTSATSMRRGGDGSAQAA